MKKIIKFIFNNYSRFSYKRLHVNDVVIIDGTGLIYLKQSLLKNINYAVIYNRGEIYYFSIPIALKTIINIFFTDCSYMMAYYLSLLQTIKPKVVITYHKIDFGQLKKYYDAEYIYIQNGFIIPRSIEKTKLSYIPNLFCFGQHDINIYSKLNIKVDNFFPLGSLKAGYYKKHLAIKNNPIKYDICLVSQFRQDIMKFGIYPEFKEAYIKLQKYLLKYLESRTVRFAIAMVSHKQESHLEKSYYKNSFGNKATILENKMEEYSTYFVMDQSELVISLNSTAVFEALGWGQKIFIFSLSANLDFTLNRECSKHHVMYKDSYQEFEDKIDSLRKMTNKEYSRLVQKDKKVFMNYNPQFPAHEVIREKIMNTIVS